MSNHLQCKRGANGNRNGNKLPALLSLFTCLVGALATWFLIGQTVAAATVIPRLQSQVSANGITAPEPDSTISGTVTVTGTAIDPNYLRYELAFRVESGAAEWIVFAEGDEQVQDGVLALWDTTVGRNVNAPVWPDGRYQLRLRVVRTDYNYSEHFLTGLEIRNANPVTPTPTPTLTGTVPPPSIESGTPVFAPLTPIPSLTPFPTPTPLPTAVDERVVETEESSSAPTDPQGIAGQLAEVDTGRFSSAFWRGARITGLLFGALAMYLLLRWLGRRLWRLAWRQRPDERPF